MILKIAKTKKHFKSNLFDYLDYELKNETNTSDKNTHGTVYLIVHGDNGKTGKIELNDGSLENSSSDEYLFNAPDVGKINKIELFYTPTYPNSSNFLLLYVN